MSNRILDYPEATEITSNDYILLDNEGTGAKCIKASALNINMDNYTIKEASGAIASFDDGEDLPLAFLGAYITAIQDLHGYDYPWVGGSGANKWDEEWQIGDIDGNTGEVKTGQYLISKNLIQVEPSTAYYFYIPSLFYIFKYDENQNILGFEAVTSSKAVTIPSDTHYIRFRNDVRDASQIYGNNISINYPSSVTTYSPYSNECPISGRSEANVGVVGKNILDDDATMPTITGLTITKNADGSISISGSTSSQTWIPLTQNGTLFKNGVNYVFSGCPSGGSSTTYQMDIRKTNKLGSIYQSVVDRGSGYAFVGTDETAYVGILIRANAEIDVTFKPQIETGTQPSTYSPYNGNTYSLTFTDGTNPLTVYGGYVDLVSGQLVVNRAYISIDKDTTISRFRVANNIGVAYYLHTDILRNNSGSNCISNKLKTYTGNSFYNYPLAFSVASDTYSASNYSVAIAVDTNITTQEEYVAWLETVGSIQVTYKLATPLTYSLTKQQIRSLVGENNIFADTGDSVVDYRKLWVMPEM